MADITLYTTPICPYCVRAKDLLKRKGRADYREINIASNPDAMKEMLAKSGGRKTVPQIFIGDTYVGGCNDLYALDSKGELDVLLK